MQRATENCTPILASLVDPQAHRPFREQFNNYFIHLFDDLSFRQKSISTI